MSNWSETLNIILALITVFQWLDRRSKNRAIENFISATQKIADRLRGIEPKNEMVVQKSLDICENLQAILHTIKGRVFGLVKRQK